MIENFNTKVNRTESRCIYDFNILIRIPQQDTFHR